MSTISASTTSTTAFKITTDTTGALVFQTGASPTTAMTLGSDQSVTFAGTPTYSGGTANGVAYLNASKVLTTGTALVFDGSNLGLGVTLSGWGGGASKVLEFGNAGSSLWSITAGATQLSSAAYYNGGWKYANSSTRAAYYEQYLGGHYWYTAASGTAGNAISFTQAMTLDTSGNLGIGATSVSASLQIQKAVPSFWMAETTSGTLQRVECSVSSVGVFNQNLNWNAGSASRAFTWSQGGTENMRINSSGNLLVGTTSDVKTWNNSLIKMRVENGIQFGTYSCIAEDLFDVDSLGICVDSSENLCFGQYNTVGGSYTERARIDSSGNFFVGGPTLSSGFSTYTGSRQYIYTSALIQMRDPINTSGRTWQCGPEAAVGGTFIVYNAASTGVYLAYGGTSWSANSDERVKDIIEPITDAANKVSTLRAVIGKYKKDADGVRRSFLIAQDVQAVLPEAVNVQEDEIGTLGVSYTDVIPLLVAAIKEQQAIITQLTSRIETLEAA